MYMKKKVITISDSNLKNSGKRKVKQSREKKI
jgi:hypothetical protein